jgi:DivIVA domain-containing protein
VSTNATFRRSGRLRRGYAPQQVEAFFARARTAYEQAGTHHRAILTSRDVRQVGFDLVLNGFDVEQVDAALDRMEDAFARREAEVLRGRLGADRAMERILAQAATLEGRLERGEGERFARASGLSLSYAPEDVDELCERLRAYFKGGEEVAPEDLRRAVFRAKRGRSGYDERQVDAFFDRAVEVLVAVD